jgi:hypothetical protein
MARTFIAAMLVLVAAVVLAAPASAHGGHNDHVRAIAGATHETAPAPVLIKLESALAIPVGTAPRPFGTTLVAADNLGAANDECPAGMHCCAQNCCLSLALTATAPDQAPGIVGAPVAIRPVRQPDDAPPTTQLRPPCR